LIRLPGGANARSIPQIVESIDLLPTLLELTGTPQLPGIQGNSLVPLLRGGNGHVPVAISESPFFGHRRAIAAGDYRLFWTVEKEHVELYRFLEDPDEQEDLSRMHPEVVERLRGVLDGWQALVARSGTFQEEGGELDPEVLESLRALGYLQ
jgi:arylsulfatase A-like enzyme